MKTKPKKTYWVVGENFGYYITAVKPGLMDGHAIAFDTIAAAKAQARQWIANDRLELEVQLRGINKTKASDL